MTLRVRAALRRAILLFVLGLIYYGDPFRRHIPVIDKSKRQDGRWQWLTCHAVPMMQA
jgi:hypothetical protein